MSAFCHVQDGAEICVAQMVVPCFKIRGGNEGRSQDIQEMGGKGEGWGKGREGLMCANRARENVELE